MTIRSEHRAHQAMTAGAQSLRIGSQFHKPAPVRAARCTRVNYWPALGMCVAFVAPALALVFSLI